MTRARDGLPYASSPNVLPPELIASPVVTGSTVVENPTTVDVGRGSTVTIGHYGYLEDGPLLPAPGSTAEATKTEPDNNTPSCENLEPPRFA